MNAYEIWLNHVEDIVHCRTPATRFTQKRSFLHPAGDGDYHFYTMPTGAVYLNVDETTYIFEVGEVILPNVDEFSINWLNLGDLLTEMIPIEVARDMVRMYSL